MSVGKADTKIVSRSPWQALEVLFWDTNTIRLLPVLASVVAYSVQVGNYWKGVAIYFGFLLFADVCYYNFAIPIFGPEAAIRRGYNLSGYFNDTLYSVGLDYGFNFYNGDYEKTRRQAQQDKFEYAFEHMGLKPGASVFDCGCGCGDWLNWLQTVKKCKVVGVNISSLQALECRERGLHVITSNWKTLDLEKEGLVGQFDAITFWDTVEHYINGASAMAASSRRMLTHQPYRRKQVSYLTHLALLCFYHDNLTAVCSQRPQQCQGTKHGLSPDVRDGAETVEEGHTLRTHLDLVSPHEGRSVRRLVVLLGKDFDFVVLLHS